MKVWGSNRTVTLSVILAFSVFLVFLGMRMPIAPKNGKPRINTRAVVDTQIKAAKSGIEAGSQAVELCRSTTLVEPPSFRTVYVRPVAHSAHPPVVLSVPARAPPRVRA